MVVGFFTALLYGPQGPETKRRNADLNRERWGRYLEEAFDGKDDEGFVDKTLLMMKHAMLPATLFYIMDVNMFNRKGGIPNLLNVAKYHYVPWLGGCAAYTSTVMVASALRGGKTDQTNHIFGGFAAGAVLGKHTRSFLTGMVSGCFFAALGYAYKDSRMNGWDVMPAIWEQNPMHGNAFTHKLDFTTNWFPPRPGYWARNEKEVETVFKRGQMGDGNYEKKLW